MWNRPIKTYYTEWPTFVNHMIIFWLKLCQTRCWNMKKLTYHNMWAVPYVLHYERIHHTMLCLYEQVWTKYEIQILFNRSLNIASIKKLIKINNPWVRTFWRLILKHWIQCMLRHMICTNKVIWEVFKKRKNFWSRTVFLLLAEEVLGQWGRRLHV